jgi:hypothetical protein
MPRILPKLDPNSRHSPVVVKQLEHRASDLQLRIADAITAFAGSMMFVYIHIAAFAVWMLVFEKSPWPTLTLVVSLEGRPRLREGGGDARGEHRAHADDSRADATGTRVGVRAGVPRHRMTAVRTRRSNTTASAAIMTPTTPSSQ